MSPEKMFTTVRDGVFPFIKSLGSNGGTREEGDFGHLHHQLDDVEIRKPAVPQITSLGTGEVRSNGSSWYLQGLPYLKLWPGVADAMILPIECSHGS
jgi:hypothetical protein